MKTRLAILMLALMAGMAAAAVTPVWTAPQTLGQTIHPYGKWYTFTDGDDAAIDTGSTTVGDVPAKRILATVGTDEDNPSTAGVGFGWGAKADSIKDLSAFSGVCLTYTATASFRMDFKQSTIKDYAYNGAVVPAQTSLETVYFAFEDFKQESWGKKVALDLTKQTGVQFSYKTALVTSGKTSNNIKLASIAFTTNTSCENSKPTLKTGVTSPAVEELPEGDTLKVAFADIFEDADDDDLNIVVAIDGYAEDIKGGKSYGLKDVAWIVSKANPKGANTSATVTFTAKDSQGASVTYTVDLTLIDRENAPSAVPDFYEMNEDDTLTVTVAKGVIINDADADGDKFEITAHTEPQHGKLIKFTALTGGFTYVPDADYFGTDTFTYTITDATEKESVGTVTITINNVDDPATVVVADSTFYVGDLDEENAVAFKTGLSVKEDFGEVDLIIPAANVVFSDPDEGAAIAPKVKSKKGLFEAEIITSGENYVLSLTSVADANGKDAIVLYVGEGKTVASVEIPVTVAPVADPPKAVNDTYTVGQGEKTEISAAKGVLANDIDPDGESALKAILVEGASEGKVVLAEDGSFTYEVGEYEGEDAFAYVAVNADGDTSNLGIVYLDVVYKNKAPVILAGVADTVGNRLAELKEDFSGKIEYRAAEVVGWFKDPEGDKITYSLSNPDSLVSATMNSSNVITVRAMKNACGEGSFNVVATDTNGNATTLKIPVAVSCVNDAPVRIGGAIDTIYKQRSGWREAIHVSALFEDVDDSVLTLKISVNDKENVLDAEVVDDSLIVKLVDESRYMQNHVPYTIKLVATDEGGATAIAKTLVFITDPEHVAIPQLATASKLGWQGAIRAERGMAAIFDMQGRVMWKAALPVSEAQVRNAAAKVQGRKILQVNKQVWTIK